MRIYLEKRDSCPHDMDSYWNLDVAATIESKDVATTISGFMTGVEVTLATLDLDNATNEEIRDFVNKAIMDYAEHSSVPFGFADEEDADWYQNILDELAAMEYSGEERL